MSCISTLGHLGHCCNQPIAERLKAWTAACHRVASLGASTAARRMRLNPIPASKENSWMCGVACSPTYVYHHAGVFSLVRFHGSTVKSSLAAAPFFADPAGVVVKTGPSCLIHGLCTKVSQRARPKNLLAIHVREPSKLLPYLRPPGNHILP